MRDALRISPQSGTNGPVSAPEPAALAPHFPHLEILGLLGQGGMGAVYKARQVNLDRLVALKVLCAEWDRDPSFPERLTREARAMARLNHPHIVSVHDFDKAGGYFYLLMEFVEGTNLRQLLQSGPLDPVKVVNLISQICDALQYAHEEGVVHRDVKPENILIDRRGRVKIADFGLAKLVGPSQASFTLTGSHQVMGTLDYMAPEQRNCSQEVDHRADIYSVGVVFYEMLTGKLPLGRFSPPSQAAAVDGRLDEVILRALEGEPDRRYQQASDMKAEVETILDAAPESCGKAKDANPSAEVPCAQPADTEGNGSDPGPETSGAADLGGVKEPASDPGPLPFAFSCSYWIDERKCLEPVLHVYVRNDSHMVLTSLTGSLTIRWPDHDRHRWLKQSWAYAADGGDAGSLPECPQIELTAKINCLSWAPGETQSFAFYKGVRRVLNLQLRGWNEMYLEFDVTVDGARQHHKAVFWYVREHDGYTSPRPLDSSSGRW